MSDYQARPLLKAFATNQSASAFTAKAATVTRPSGNGVVALAESPGQVIPCRARLFPYGLGSDNDVFSLRVWGWHRLAGTSTLQELLVPAALLEISCTISTAVGVAGTPVLATERFADTISVVATVGEPKLTADVTNSGTLVWFSPANNTPAWVEFETRGCELLEFDTDQTTGTPTANALVLLL